VDTFGRLAQWVEIANAVHQLATNLVKTSFVPDAYRNKPHEATAAILAGTELGLSPLAALRSFDVINGVAAVRALTMRAVVQSHGHRIWESEIGPDRVVVCGQRKGETQVHQSEWTIERATKLKLIAKDNWVKQPQAMLVARATAECARMTAADALLGIPYSAEELADISPVQVTAAVGPSLGRVTAAEIQGAVGALGSAPTPAVGTEAVHGVATHQQIKTIHTLRNQLEGFAGATAEARELFLVHCSSVIGRQVDSTKDLAVGEASEIIDDLRRALAAQEARASADPQPSADQAVEPTGGQP
jgi:hypothetical protein